MGNITPQLSIQSISILQSYLSEFQTAHLVGITDDEFEQNILQYLSLTDSSVESSSAEKNQPHRPEYSHWGHEHDFGKFALKGKMGTRHIWLLSRHLDCFHSIPLNLAGMNLLDVGCGTGGVSLLAARMGASVLAIDEAERRAQCVQYLATSFGLRNLNALNLSVYDLNQPEYFDRFDHIFFFGVIYHITDPLIALRNLYNCLKVGGVLHVESMSINDEASVCEYAGSSLQGGNWFIPSPLALKRMLSDVGFEVTAFGNGQTESVTTETDPLGPNRVLAVVVKQQPKDFFRKGLSNRVVR